MNEAYERLGFTAYLNLKKCLGFVENATDTVVVISQDDATKDFIVQVGKKSYNSRTLTAALQIAVDDRGEDA